MRVRGGSERVRDRRRCLDTSGVVLFLFLLLSTTVAAGPGDPPARVYWADFSARTVGRAHLDGTNDIPEGLARARRFLLEVLELGVPTATELLDPITPQYIADLVCWSAIGARTTESQTHRQMASGLSMPLGFKNGTNGALTPAIRMGISTSRSPGAPRRK